MPAVLAACEETNADGKTAIASIRRRLRGDVPHRRSFASQPTPEKLGFHAPGLTGPYGAAMAAGRVLGLNAEQLAHALGIAGSLSSGLLAFTKSKAGGMVKRLHLGRAAESGILAARLAEAGYTGPETVLDGKFGFMEVYCRDARPQPAHGRPARGMGNAAHLHEALCLPHERPDAGAVDARADGGARIPRAGCREHRGRRRRKSS